MVTINIQQLTHGWSVAVSCLEADPRPAEIFPPGGFPAGPVPMPNGAFLLELDTGKEFRFDAEGGTWLEQPARGNGAPRCDVLATFDWANVQLGWGFDDVYPAA